MFWDMKVPECVFNIYNTTRINGKFTRRKKKCKNKVWTIMSRVRVRIESALDLEPEKSSKLGVRI